MFMSPWVTKRFSHFFEVFVGLVSIATTSSHIRTVLVMEKLIVHLTFAALFSQQLIAQYQHLHG